MSGTVWPQVVLSNANGVPYDAGTPVPVTGSISATSAATATAAAPTYVEGTSNPLSQNLSGDARVIAKQSGTWAVTGTFWQATQPVSIASMPSTPVTGTFWQATQPVSGTVTTTPPANASTNIAQMNAVTVLMGNGVTGTGSQRVTIASDNTAFSVNAVQSGTWNVGTVTTVSAVTGITNALPAGSNLIGRTVADTSAATGGIANTTRLAATAATTNALLIRNGSGRIYQVSGKNNAAYDVFFVLYDSNSSPPVPGTTTIRKKMVCPAGQAFVYDWPLGLYFATGIGYAFTKLAADADTTALAANDVTAFNMDYT